MHVPLIFILQFTMAFLKLNLRSSPLAGFLVLAVQQGVTSLVQRHRVLRMLSSVLMEVNMPWFKHFGKQAGKRQNPN